MCCPYSWVDLFLWGFSSILLSGAELNKGGKRVLHFLSLQIVGTYRKDLYLSFLLELLRSDEMFRSGGLMYWIRQIMFLSSWDVRSGGLVYWIRQIMSLSSWDVRSGGLVYWIRQIMFLSSWDVHGQCIRRMYSLGFGAVNEAYLFLAFVRCPDQLVCCSG